MKYKKITMQKTHDKLTTLNKSIDYSIRSKFSLNDFSVFLVIFVTGLNLIVSPSAKMSIWRILV